MAHNRERHDSTAEREQSSSTAAAAAQQQQSSSSTAAAAAVNPTKPANQTSQPNHFKTQVNHTGHN